MPVDCKLCGESIGPTDGTTRCRCGWRLDAGCEDGHDAWCPVEGTESWIGAQEF